jgi:hypothetical protein
MKMTAARIASVFAAFSTLTIAGVAGAQEVPAGAQLTAVAPAPAAASMDDSINASPMGLVYGTYSLNYEHLFKGGHGILLEGGYSADNNDDISVDSGYGLIGYRYHFNGTQNSWFVGASASYGVATGTAKIDDEKYSASIMSFGLTGNVGKRWQFDNGLNITFRAGAGYGQYTVDIDSNDPDAIEAEKDINDFLTLIPVALEGELSLGYSF